ncbi:hypothetical protein DEDE109153_12860 [Deinococcus deserti]
MIPSENPHPEMRRQETEACLWPDPYYNCVRLAQHPNTALIGFWRAKRPGKRPGKCHGGVTRQETFQRRKAWVGPAQTAKKPAPGDADGSRDVEGQESRDGPSVTAEEDGSAQASFVFAVTLLAVGMQVHSGQLLSSGHPQRSEDTDQF